MLIILGPRLNNNNNKRHLYGALCKNLKAPHNKNYKTKAL